MKKVFKVFLALICVMLLVSCEKLSHSKQEELMSFFKSHSIDVTYELQAQDISMEVFSLNARKDVIQFETSEELDAETKVSFIVDIENNNLFYDLGKRFIYTKIPNSNTTTELNVEKYISDIREVDGDLTFWFDMAEYFEDSNLDLNDYIIYDPLVKFTAVFKMNKIVELSYSVEGITSVMKIGGYVYKDNVEPESAGLKKIELPNIDDCLYLTEEEFVTHVETGASGDIENYEMIIQYNDFAWINGNILVSEFSGYIYDKSNEVNVKRIYLDDIYYNEEDVMISEDGKFNIYTDYCGKTFSAEIQVDTDPEAVFDRYIFRVVYHDVTILRDEFTASYFQGYIYDTKKGKYIKNIGLDDLIYDIEEIRSSKDGKIELSTEFCGLMFTTEIEAKIINEEVLDTYKLIITSHDFTILKDELYVSSVSGYIYDTVNEIPLKNVSISDIYYDEENILSSEDYTFTVSTEYYDREFTAEVQAILINDANIESRNIPTDIGKIKYGFAIDNNIYICNERYLYIFDQNCENILAQIDLQCIGKSHYVKDDYLYITSYMPYETTFLPSDSFTGYVTKIKLSDFTVEKQVRVNCLPNSIIVDNRDKVILSKSANQHVNVDEVDMETGKLTPLIRTYQNDVLLYDSYNDILSIITCGHTGDNELYVYDGTKWNFKGYNTFKNKKLLYSSQDSLIFDDGVYVFDSASSNYVFNVFNYSTMILNYNFKKQCAVIDDEYVYIIEREQGNQFNSLVIYNISTNSYNRYFLPKTYDIDVSFMYKIADDIYCVDTNGIIYKIII